MNFFIDDQNIAKQYIHELFTGSTKIASFCKFNDCERCFSTTKLYERVLSYHDSELVQKLFGSISADYAKRLLNIPLA
jgi:putative ribosome biogenesis GTPase RsgA